MSDYFSSDDTPIVSSLKDKNLFHVIRPEEVVDKKATEALAGAFNEIIVSGRLDHLINSPGQNVRKSAFGSLSMSRLGYYGDQELADSIFQDLKSRGLADDSEDGITIPMHQTVRALILVLLAWILKSRGESMGMTLSPATDQRDLINALGEILKPESAPPAAGDIVSFDTENVGVDLGAVPMDEILDFRQQHYRQHRDYILSVRQFARELSLMPPDEREAKFEQRQEELKTLSHDLIGIYRGSWKTRFSFGIGLAGAAWAASQGDPIAGALTALAAGSALIDKPKEVGVYSYLILTKQKFQ